jgi:hypothetical protein
LKRRVRDIIDPGRDLGHVDGKKRSTGAADVSSSHYYSTGNATAPEAQLENSQRDNQMQEKHLLAKSNVPLRDDNLEWKSTSVDEGRVGNQGEEKQTLDRVICEDCN